MDPYIRALMEDDLDEVLAEWSEKDGLELMESGDEEELLRASRRAEQQGGNPLFAVTMQRIQPTRSFQNGVALQSQVRFFLRQLREPSRELQGEAIAEAIRQGLVNFVRDPVNGLTNPEDYSLAMAVHHSSGNNLWTSTKHIPLKEWIDGSEYTRGWLEQLAKQLNSIQSLEAADGEFYVQLSFFRTERRGGKPGKTNVKRLSFKDILGKRSILEIKNTDNLCLARALITVKAYVDKDPQFKKEIRKGGEFLCSLAHQLHEAAGVPKGTCGKEEILQFQQHLGEQGYQIKVFDGHNGALLFHKKEFDMKEKKLCLVQMGHHFHGVTKVPALLNTSYYCHECNRGFCVEDAEHHNCVRQNCDLCKRKQSKCKAFKEKKPASLLCKDCNRKFRGVDCFAAHKRTACAKFKKCLECCKVYKYNKKKKHVCGEYSCSNCKSNVPVNHQCYIQPIKEEKQEEFCRLEIPGLSAEDQDLLDAMKDMERELQGEKKEKPPPLVCCIDFECSVDDHKEFEDVLVGWQYLNDPDSYREAGKAVDMLDDVIEHTTTENGEERQVFVFAHNMRGFDSSFILQHLYEKGIAAEKILSMGAKYLSFQCGNIIFRDSLNFFNMPLERLPNTFNFQEAHKGFFPYSWICESKRSYVGPYPPAKDYHPDRMNEKRRKEFLTWHRQKVESGEIFECWKELRRYLESDVKVLTQAMETFAKEMKELTGVDPSIECVTIASTAFRVFQKNFLEPGLIALEPARGWRHNQQNQSVEALQWLEYENHKIGGGIQVSFAGFYCN